MSDEKHPVWEETWDTCDGVISIEQKTKHYTNVDGRFAWEQDPNVGAFGDLSGASPFNPELRDESRARMASVAPEAIRALKKIEWAGEVDNVCWECCLFCGGLKRGLQCTTKNTYAGTCTQNVEGCCIDHSTVGHKNDCEWMYLMRKAGVDELILVEGC